MSSLKRKMRTEERNITLDKILTGTSWFVPCCLFKKNRELNNLISLMSKFGNRVVGSNHVVFSDKIYN